MPIIKPRPFDKDDEDIEDNFDNLKDHIEDKDFKLWLPPRVFNTDGGGGGGGDRLAAWDNPPASSHAYDDEFDSGSLDGKWTPVSLGTTNPITSGTINHLSNLTTPIYDAASMASRLALQSDNSSGQSFGIRQSVSLDTNCTIFVKILPGSRYMGGTSRGDIYIILRNSTANLNDCIQGGIARGSSSSFYKGFAQVRNGGAISTNFTQDFTPASFYYVIWKVGNVYHYGYSGDETGLITWFFTYTKTGTTTMNYLDIVGTSGADTPSIIVSIDFIRYYASNVYNFLNP